MPSLRQTMENSMEGFDHGELTSSSRSSEITSDFDENREIRSGKISLSAEDVALKLKYGDDEEFKLGVLGFSELIAENTISGDWIECEGVIPALFNRLDSSKTEFRLIIIRLLRALASNYLEIKEKMAKLGFLSTLVQSLIREEDERRESVGLLLELSEIDAVRRRIGRIRGCIVMLVALLNGEDDPIASSDAANLLHRLSSNTQNALHMAEAGHFKPIIQFLKEGSDMSKILMATAISRMELTDHTRDSLGEDGAVEPLVKMFTAGKLEAKLSALNALQNLSGSPENVRRIIRSSVLSPLLQLLFSVTSVMMTLREPASAILAKIAESEDGILDHDVAHQMLSLLSLSNPVIQTHLLQALNGVVSSPSASEIRHKMKECGAISVLLPFLTETNSKIRTSSLNLLFSLSNDSSQELSEHLGETHVRIIAGIATSSSASESERAPALGILGLFPIGDKKFTEKLKRENLLPVIVSATSSKKLEESASVLLIRFTSASDKKLQLYSVENGAILALVNLLRTESPLAKKNAATALAQLSQNSLSLSKSRVSRWVCVSRSSASFCEVHGGLCSVKNTFCLVKAGAVPVLIEALGGGDRSADEAMLGALMTLIEDEIWESGIGFIAGTSSVDSFVKVLESPLSTVKAKEKALWILERVFRVDENRAKFGESVQIVLIDLAQKGDSRLKSAIAKLLAQLDLLQEQSSYF